MSDAPNVNPNGNISNEINVKRLGHQQKEILRYLYESGKVHKQVEIIEALYGEVTDSRKASVSRSISKLRGHDLLLEQNCLYYPNLDGWYSSRPHYGITELGEKFLEADSRFPEIDGGKE